MSPHKSFIKTSDFALATSLLMAILLEYLYRTKITEILNTESDYIFITGVLLIIFAWIIIIKTKQIFRKNLQKTGPGQDISKLITNGIFKYSRNPIYLGVVIINMSLSLIFNSVWLLILTLYVFLYIEYLLIKPEEIFLKENFEVEYKEYCKKTRRWI
jgi:protein-S-isoprenylcysteine O-methyltransferase Ste14